EPLALHTFGDTRAGAEAVAFDLDADHRSLDQVLEPAGVVGSAALRRNDDGRIAVEVVDERRRRLPAGEASGRRQEEDRRALLPVVADLAIGLPITPDVLLAVELRGVRAAHANASNAFVVSLSRACTDSSRCFSFVSSSFVCESPRRD